MSLRKFFKILKYTFYGIFSLIIIAYIGLLFYYQSIYREIPLPAEAVAKPAFNSSLASFAKPVLLPIPKKMTWISGRFILPTSTGFEAPKEDIETIKKICQERLNILCEMNTSGSFKFIKSRLIESQSYILDIQP